MHQSKDYIHQLVDYIRKNLSKGYTLDSLKYSLMSQGYSRISVEKASEIANKQIAEMIPEIKEKPQITYKIIDKENKPIEIPEIKPKRSFWRRLFE